MSSRVDGSAQRNSDAVPKDHCDTLGGRNSHFHLLSRPAEESRATTSESRHRLRLRQGLLQLDYSHTLQEAFALLQPCFLMELQWAIRRKHQEPEPQSREIT